ncbi:hypothetical protein [Bacteroides sp. 224]|uniref:hypothetical protein n=1 Tax=Bacteroides sp. 224 TaxID=2302936 RepID=UPI0013D33F9F|nr:hypothetical protein [Bacteroides sp. 224]NDV65747.1 hypothetical protein [Bacteroides sp. 224]
MKRDLQRIANTVLLYSYHTDNKGLLDGKMGIALFLYSYARYSNGKYYSDFADDLLDEILASAARIPTTFEDGLTGIGWAVNYLIKNKLVEGDPNEVLNDVDKRVFSHLRCDPSISIFGHAIYLTERIRDNANNPVFEQYITQCLDFCHKGLNGYKGTISLNNINSILFFLIETDKMKQFNHLIKSIRVIIPDVLKRISEQKWYDSADVFIFNRIVNSIPLKQRNKWKSISQFTFAEVSRTDDMEYFIRTSWLEELYFGENSFKKQLTENTGTFVNDKQINLCHNDFFFSKGLAGLGFALLSNNQ